MENRENIQIKGEDGKLYWVTERFHAICCIPYFKDPDTGKFKYVMVKRGPSNFTFVGHFGFPCGYLNSGETRIEGAVRELYEETGMLLKKESLKEHSIQDNPEEDPNITTRYLVPLKKSDYTLWESLGVFSKNREPEVTDIQAFTYEEAKEKQIAFNHLRIIKQLEDELRKRF